MFDAGSLHHYPLISILQIVAVDVSCISQASAVYDTMARDLFRLGADQPGMTKPSHSHMPEQHTP